MNARERTKAIFGRNPSDRHGFWLGNPVWEARKQYADYFGISNENELEKRLGSDFAWIPADWLAWKHPQGKGMLFGYKGGESKTREDGYAVFAECEDLSEVEAYDWPNPDYLDFTPVIEKAEKAAAEGIGVVGGMWTAFFHNVADLFGMEDYFIKMYTHPEIVEAVTQHVVDFYLEANRRCFDAMAGKLDAFFFGNDFGTQLDLLISREMFQRFVLPGFRQNIELAKSYGLKVMLHSCGAISKVIPDLIDSGVDALHPLQARAKGMEAEKLAAEYKDHLVFVGGVDTQQLLPFGTPDEVRAEVRRLKKAFGEYYFVSPSHEALLPNVPPENVAAMVEAALE